MGSKGGKICGGGISDSDGMKWWRSSQEKENVTLWEEEKGSADHTTIWHFAFPSISNIMSVTPGSRPSAQWHSSSLLFIYIYSPYNLSPPSLFLFPSCHLSYRCSCCLLFPFDAQPKLTSWVHTPSAYYRLLVSAWLLLPTTDSKRTLAT